MKEIDIPPLMRETLRGLTYKEQLEFFRLTKDWDVTSEAKLNKSMSLMVLESDDVESIIVCDGIVVGVNVKLNDVYFSYTTDSSAEFFNKPSGKVHQLSRRYGGEYYSIYSNAKYTFACILYR